MKRLAVSVILVLALGCTGGDGEGEASAPADAAKAAGDSSPEPEPAAFEAWCGDGPCPCAEGSAQTFHATEDLSSCDLSADTLIQGTPCMAAGVRFSPEGRLTECFPSQAISSDGYQCQEQRTLRFHRSNGALQECTLLAAARVDGIACTVGRAIELHDDGSLRRCFISEEATFGDLVVRAKTSVTLEDGKLYRLDIFGDGLAVGDLTCIGNFNFFHPNGQIGQCKLASPASIDGQSFDQDTNVCFDEAGELVDCSVFTWTTT